MILAVSYQTPNHILPALLTTLIRPVHHFWSNSTIRSSSGLDETTLDWRRIISPAPVTGSPHIEKLLASYLGQVGSNKSG